LKLPDLNADQLDLLKALRAEGQNLTTCANAIGRSVGWLEKSGLLAQFPKPNVSLGRRLDLTPPQLATAIDLFDSGIGASGIVKQLGVPIGAIKRAFAKEGLTLRNRSEQQFARMANADPAERKRLTDAAHRAVRGKPLSLAARLRIAQAGKRHSSVTEDRVADELQQRGIEFDRQFPIHVYNADFLIQPAGAGALPIAMEVFGGHWHRYGEHARRFPERSRQILSSHHLLILWATPMFPLAAGLEHAITQLELLRRLPAPVGQYRVIWGELGLTATGCAEDVERALIPPTENRRDPATGRYCRVTRDAAEM
jgi:hypothetical protein